MNKGYYSSTDSHILSEPQSPAVNLNYSKTVQVFDRLINFDNMPYPPTIYSMARAWVFNNPTSTINSYSTHSTVIAQDLSPNSPDTEKPEEKRQSQTYQNNNNPIQNTIPQSLCDSSKSYINSMEDVPVELLLKSHVMKAKAQKKNYEEQLSKDLAKYRNKELYKRIKIIQKHQKQMMENQQSVKVEQNQ